MKSDATTVRDALVVVNGKRKYIGLLSGDESDPWEEPQLQCNSGLRVRDVW